MTSEPMEARLRALVEANNEQNRFGWASRWKAGGGCVAALLCSYIPREVLYALGYLPWRVTGSWEEPPELAAAHRQPWSSPKNTAILEVVLRGEVDFADAVVGSDWDIDLKRLWDAWVALKKPPLAHVMFVPRLTTRLHCEKMRQSTGKLVRAAETALGKKLDTGVLRSSIRVYNRQRELIRKMYELRKRAIPVISGAEALGITTAALVMPPEQFNAELAALLPFLDKRKARLQQHSPRLLVSSDSLDDIRYLELVEDVGCVVAMDDLDTGSRFFWSQINESAGDPLLALATAYLTRPGCPRMMEWEGQINQVMEWVREFEIDGVLELVLNYSMIRHFRSPFMKSALEQAGIPFHSLTREHQFANESQLRTRIGAFVELIEAAHTVVQ